VTDWQFKILGYQSSVGEVIIIIVLPSLATLLVALLVEPLRRWLSRTWNFFLDRISSLSSHLRASRIGALELKIKFLNQYNDRQVMMRLLRGMSGLILLVGLTIFVSISVAQNDILMNTLQITNFFKIPDSSFLSVAQSVPGKSILIATEILYISYLMLLLLLLVLTFSLVAAIFQEMDDFADPPKAIQRLEERINALRGKST
jgi:hypothetical protein